MILESRYETRATAAKALGIEPSQLSRFFNDGKNGRNIGGNSARKFEEELNKPHGWLDIPQWEVDRNLGDLTDINVSGVPLMSWEMIGVTMKEEDLRALPTHQTNKKIDFNGFASVLKNDSMDAPAGVRPTYPEGFTILVNRDIPAEHGADCVFRMNGSSEAVFRRLIIDGGVKYLKPLNEIYPMVQLPDDAEYIGRVVQVSLDC